MKLLPKGHIPQCAHYMKEETKCLPICYPQHLQIRDINECEEIQIRILWIGKHLIIN